MQRCYQPLSILITMHMANPPKHHMPLRTGEALEHPGLASNWLSRIGGFRVNWPSSTYPKLLICWLMWMLFCLFGLGCFYSIPYTHTGPPNVDSRSS